MTIVVGSATGTSYRSPVARTSGLRIRRESIRWTGGIAGRPLEIQFVAENLGAEPSTPRPVQIDVAPFGAFLPWRPLTTLTLPGIPPGGRVVMTATAGDDELPPRRLAIGRWGSGQPISAESEDAQLEFYQAISNPEVAHFVGNLNVHVRECEPVERHLERAIGLQAGATNWSMFIVGNGREDRYTFRPEAERGWSVDVYPGGWGTPLCGRRFVAMVRFVPPADAKRGRVAIWVHRASTDQEVPVEFELTTNAPEAHCYQR